jgi:ribosomal protein S18 acetylase RimI-like enzyme
MAALEIGPGREVDLASLFVLAKSEFGHLPGWSDGRALEVLRSDMVFVARDGTQPAGYVALHRDDLSASIVVEQLFVAPGYERRGVGHRLLAFAEGFAIAERQHALRIVVEHTNWRARDFYRRAGFVPVEVELLELVLPGQPK